MATIGERVYAIGGFNEQNRAPHSQCFVWDAGTDAWQRIRPLPSPRDAISAVALNGKIHSVGGRDADSVDVHQVYDPGTDRWETLAPLPDRIDHIGAVEAQGRIHAIGGRKDNFHFNTGLHHVFEADTGRWRRPRRCRRRARARERSGMPGASS